MPPDLTSAHQALDAVDATYRRKSPLFDAERVAFLFELYRKYTTFLPSEQKASKARCKAKKPKKSAH